MEPGLGVHTWEDPLCLVWAEPSDSSLMNRILKKLWDVTSENRF